MLSVNGTEIVFPKSYQVILSDIDGNSERNANGELIRDRIVAGKRKLEMEWQPLTQEEMSALLTATEDTFFEVSFLDPKEGTKTCTMYVGDRTAPGLSYDYKTSKAMWSGLKMNFIEK